MTDSRHKVLIVDDEPDNLALMYRTLRRDFDVAKANGPREALAMLKEDPNYQFILSDHNMPEMDGVEFLKLSSTYAPTAVKALVTAYSETSILIDAINKAGIYRYVKKPYAPEELLHVVKICVDYYQLKTDHDTLIEDLKDLFGGTIKAITEALDAKDSNTSGRSKRVAFYSLRIAQALNLSQSDCGKIELAGLLHDIGMIGVAEDILSKADKLEEGEFEEIQKHVFHSVKILEDIKQLTDVVDIIRYHHERYDGKGYPYKLAGEEIPVGSRIITITDAFDGILSTRNYRDAKEYGETMTIMEQGAGTQFDPKILAVFKQLLPKIYRDLMAAEVSEQTKESVQTQPISEPQVQPQQPVQQRPQVPLQHQGQPAQPQMQQPQRQQGQIPQQRPQQPAPQRPVQPQPIQQSQQAQVQQPQDEQERMRLRLERQELRRQAAQAQLQQPVQPKPQPQQPMSPQSPQPVPQQSQQPQPQMRPPQQQGQGQPQQPVQPRPQPQQQPGPAISQYSPQPGQPQARPERSIEDLERELLRQQQERQLQRQQPPPKDY